MGDMEIPDELIDQLLGEYQGPEQLTGPDGLINQLRRRLIERAAGAELEQHLGYPPGAEPPEAQPNRRNGCGVRKPDLTWRKRCRGAVLRGRRWLAPRRGRCRWRSRRRIRLRRVS